MQESLPCERTMLSYNKKKDALSISVWAVMRGGW